MRKLLALWLALALLYLVGFPALLVGTMPEHNWLVYYGLMKAGHATPGSVSEIHRKTHCSFNYTYSVDRQEFRGLGTDCDIKVGTLVQVHFMPDNPRLSCAFPPKDMFENELMAILLGFLIFPTFVAFALAIRAIRK
jgi:hypothetical protein